jgi:hypothetical protein
VEAFSGHDPESIHLIRRLIPFPELDPFVLKVELSGEIDRQSFAQ